jgi:hypothetical protein
MKFGWTGHVARTGEIVNTSQILLENPEGKKHMRDLCVCGSIILKWNSSKVLESRLF